MKKKVIVLVASTMFAIGALTGCTDNTMAKNFGGDMTVNLEKGQKLEEVTWKDDSLWYLTRPMKEGEEPQTYTFQEDSSFGIFEGTVTIVESK